MVNQMNKSGKLELAFPPTIAEQMILKSGIRFYTTNCFCIPAPIVDRYFQSYHLLYWSGDYLLKQIKEGTITKDGITYQIRFKAGLTRGKILANLENQFPISFRIPCAEYGILPVAIIGESSNV